MNSLAFRPARAPAALFVLCAACAVTSQSNLVDLRLREADSLFDSGLYLDAIRLYEFVAENRPFLKHAALRLALCYEATAQPYAAIHWYERIRDDLDQRDIFVLYRLALLYTETGFLPEAAATYRELARLEPENPLPQRMYRLIVGEISRSLPLGPPPVRPGPLPGNLQAQMEQADRLAAAAASEVESLAQEAIPQDPQARQALRARAIGAMENLNLAWGMFHTVYLATSEESVRRKLVMIDALRQFLGEYLGALRAVEAR